jgi:hypothetical protein
MVPGESAKICCGGRFVGTGKRFELVPGESAKICCGGRFVGTGKRFELVPGESRSAVPPKICCGRIKLVPGIYKENYKIDSSSFSN